MKDKRIKGFVFDLGGVVVGDMGKGFLDNTSKVLGISRNKLKTVIQKYEIGLELGTESDTTFWTKVVKSLDIDPKPKTHTLKGLWAKDYILNTPVNKDVVKIIKRLRKAGFRVVALSNAKKVHTILNKKRKLFSLFDKSFLSHESGYRKPQRKFFQLASKGLNVPFKNLVFIDDEERWLKPAKKYGFITIRFTTARSLEKRLKQLIDF